MKRIIIFFTCLVVLTSVSYSQQKKAEESSPLFPVKQNDKWGYIDKTGEAVIKPQFRVAWEFSGGLALVRIGDKYGYIDKTGKYVWEPTN